MEYQFRNFEACYDIDINLQYPDYRSRSYSSRESIRAKYRYDNLYQFELTGRDNILINGNELEETMDILMAELGKTIYPMVLNVDAKGQLLGIANFGSAHKQWHEKSKELLKAHYTVPFEKYINIASRNVENEETLINAISRNTFVKMFFMPFGTINFNFSFDNFPAKNDKIIFDCVKMEDDILLGSVKYTAQLIYPSTYKGSGYFSFEYSELGDLRSLDAKLYIGDGDGNNFEKQIRIVSDGDNRKISDKRSFWNKWFD